MITYKAEEHKTIMKQEKALNEVIYLPEYFTGQLSQTMQKQKPPEICAHTQTLMVIF